jgi:UDP-N-acetylmuramyl pentapeptide phosphotransferase/UDP-N-acetylglucosamine-1-phosphate transferase
MSPAFFLTTAAALSASLIVSWLALRAGVLDFPNARSAHTRPTPRAAGLGIVAGLGAGLAAAAFTPLAAGEMAGLLAVTGLFAALGFADDLVDLSERIKSGLFLALCLAMTAAAGPVTRLPLTLETGLDLPVWIGVLGSALFVFTVVNAVNFMDGSDGMLAAVMAPAALGLSVAGLVAGVTATSLIGAALAAALIGFALFNRPPAKAFAGDVGALAAGAAYAGAALAMAARAFPARSGWRRSSCWSSSPTCCSRLRAGRGGGG